jgi:hypothetical protein
MKRPIEIIDDFYTDEELNTLFKEMSIGTNKLEFSPTCQPHKGRDFYSSRFQAYPCHETYKVDENNLIYTNLFNKLKNSVLPDIKKLRTFFRKIYKEELLKSVCKDGNGLSHDDGGEFSYAGVIYLDERYSFGSGTKLFTRNDIAPQLEHDIQVGSVYNRCIIYPANTLHQAGFDMNINSRFIQTFFVFNNGVLSENKGKKYDINNCI